MTTRIHPDRMALEIAHRKLKSTLSLDDMLKSRTWKRILNRMAIKHMRSRAKFDAKKIQANDND